VLDFIGQTVEVFVQPVKHIAFDVVRCEITDQSSLGRVLAKLFN